jgi:hypothetical protein
MQVKDIKKVHKSGAVIEFIIEKGYEMPKSKGCLATYGTNFVD